jgi:hypothetical protein
MQEDIKLIAALTGNKQETIFKALDSNCLIKHQGSFELSFDIFENMEL